MLRQIEVTTDYPIHGDGDHSEKVGWACAWDRDKYVQVRVGDQLYWIKRGYVRRTSDGKRLGEYQLAYLPRECAGDARLPTRLETSREVMAHRRHRETSAEVYSLSESGSRRNVVFTCSSVADAVGALVKAGPGHALFISRQSKSSWTGGTAAVIDAEGRRIVYVSGRRQRADISAKQVRRLLRGAF